MPDRNHVHKFDQKITKKVLLSAGTKSGFDLLKQRKCKCGAVQTYDLERTKL